MVVAPTLARRRRRRRRLAWFFLSISRGGRLLRDLWSECWNGRLRVDRRGVGVQGDWLLGIRWWRANGAGRAKNRRLRGKRFFAVSRGRGRLGRGGFCRIRLGRAISRGRFRRVGGLSWDLRSGVNFSFSFGLGRGWDGLGFTVGLRGRRRRCLLRWRGVGIGLVHRRTWVVVLLEVRVDVHMDAFIVGMVCTGEANEVLVGRCGTTAVGDLNLCAGDVAV